MYELFEAIHNMWPLWLFGFAVMLLLSFATPHQSNAETACLLMLLLFALLLIASFPGLLMV